MLRTFVQSLFIVALLSGGGVGLFLYHEHFSTARQIEHLEQEKQQLQQVVVRLSAEKRVADVLVSKREVIDNIPRTTLLFVEYDRQGQPLPGKILTVAGDHVHFDALVVKFDRELVQKNDPLRGHSIALFTRVYGDHQTPDSATAIDEPNSIPLVYRGASSTVTSFECNLWQNFWRLARDPDYRQQFGVRIASGQGVWGPLDIDHLYTLTLESSGGLNLSAEPMKGIYREALRGPSTLPAAGASLD